MASEEHADVTREVVIGQLSKSLDEVLGGITVEVDRLNDLNARLAPATEQAVARITSLKRSRFVWMCASLAVGVLIGSAFTWAGMLQWMC